MDSARVRDRRARAWRRSAALSGAVLAALGAIPPARAAAGPSGRLLVQGLFDLELWQTDSGSRLLSRNDGELALASRLRLFGAFDCGGGFQIAAAARGEAGNALEGKGPTGEVEQAFVRWVAPGSVHLVVDAGKVVEPFGNFAARYVSSVNPLIGSPDAYDVAYPSGVVVTGKAGPLDYRAALLDRPLVNASYVPPPGDALRPGLELGVTPVVGARIALYATRGPYLGPDAKPFLPAGESWRDFRQEILGAEVAFSRGYFELNADAARSRYEVPARPEVSRGTAWFVEPKYTFTPRLFAALRVERNDYPFILPLGASAWIATSSSFYDAELGAGWRVTPGLLVKLSYRRDHWTVEEYRKAFFPDGYAVALQLSYAFDVMAWVERPR